MIKSSGRKKQLDVQPTKNISQNRKFGNIVNRLQRSINNEVKKCDQYENKSPGIENRMPSFYESSDKNNLILPSRRCIVKYKQELPVEQNTTQKKLKQFTNDCLNKQAVINRNRQFDEKVDNINKFHQQISSLLKIVKTGQSKTAVKHRDLSQNKIGKIQQNKVRNPKEKQNYELMKPRKGQIVANRSYFEQKTDRKQRKVVNQQRITNPYIRYKQNKVYAEQCQIKTPYAQEQKKMNYKNSYLKLNLEGKKFGAITQRNTTSRLNISCQINQKKFDQNSSLYNYIQLENQTSIRIPLCTQRSRTPQKYSKKLEQEHKKPAYRYNFESINQQGIQFIKSRNILPKDQKAQNSKIQSSIINYDQQIQKVKYRIQSSQQITKKMEQRYLGSQKVSKKREQNSISYVNLLQIQQQIEKKPLQQPKARLTKNFSYLNKSQTKIKKISYQVDNRQNNKFTKKEQLCRNIAQKISTQVKLDQRLRDAKSIFNENKTKDKWRMLQQKLKKLGYNFSQVELENQLQISSNQFNPFISKTSLSVLESVEKLAQSFIKSQQFWDRQLYKFLSKDIIQKSGFKVEEIDLDHRGYITIQDLVCFVNMYTANFYRNRDMVYLFRRMIAFGKNRNGIQYECFTGIISYS